MACNLTDVNNTCTFNVQYIRLVKRLELNAHAQSMSCNVLQRCQLMRTGLNSSGNYAPNIAVQYRPPLMNSSALQLIWYLRSAATYNR